MNREHVDAVAESVDAQQHPAGEHRQRFPYTKTASLSLISNCVPTRQSFDSTVAAMKFLLFFVTFFLQFNRVELCDSNVRGIIDQSRM